MTDDRQYLIENENNLEHNSSQQEQLRKKLHRNEEIGESSQSSDVSLIPSDKSKRLPQYIAAIAATLSALSAGIVLAWTSPISTDLEHGKYHNIKIDQNEMGWIGSFVTLGAITTCIPYGFVCDIIGRKTALLLLIIPYSVGWSLIVWAKSLLMLYAGRFITGMAAGACCVAAPLYISEIAQKELRGTLGSYFQLMVTVGILIAYTLGKFMNVTHYTVICANIPYIFFILFVFQVESPVYSLKKGKFETAKNSLIALQGSTSNVDNEMELLKQALDTSNRNNLSKLVYIKQLANKKALVIALALMTFQQLSGINAVIFYTSDIFEASGVKMDPKTASIIVGAFQVVFTFISSIYVEKLGRKILLIASHFIMAISIILLGFYFTLKDRQIISKEFLDGLAFLPVLSLSVYVVMFSLGLGPIPWTISNEIFSPEIKSVAAACAGTLNWFLAFIVTKFFPILKEEVGMDVIFYIFGIVCFIGSLFCYCIVPETKGKTLEQIHQELEA